MFRTCVQRTPIKQPQLQETVSQERNEKIRQICFLFLHRYLFIYFSRPCHVKTTKKRKRKRKKELLAAIICRSIYQIEQNRAIALVLRGTLS